MAAADPLPPYVAEQVSDAESEDDEGFSCDGCEQDIPQGAPRHHCTVCPNYDLCGLCFGQFIHKEHRMLQIENKGSAEADPAE